MAADILAYGADEVPVGDDQAQHVELTRDLAVRFNQRYGHTFVVPKATVPKVAARVMNLQDPTSKMGKSDDSGAGIVYLLDEPEVIRKKIMRAVTDSGQEVVYDREEQPGVANLLEILAACTGGNPESLATVHDSYGALKQTTAEAVLDVLSPVQARHKELCVDPGYVEEVLRHGAEKARAIARPIVDTAYRAIGLLPPGAFSGAAAAEPALNAVR
jgi:tryptophanyl-tRNA synthetase